MFMSSFECFPFNELSSNAFPPDVSPIYPSARISRHKSSGKRSRAQTVNYTKISAVDLELRKGMRNYNSGLNENSVGADSDYLYCIREGEKSSPKVTCDCSSSLHPVTQLRIYLIKSP